MKLISINVEGYKHLDRTDTFFKSEQADVICLQECGPRTLKMLEDAGYTTHLLPLCLKRDTEQEVYEEGVAIASRLPITFETFYYFEPREDLIEFAAGKNRESYKQGCVVGTICDTGENYHIASNHFTWAPKGNMPSQNQIHDMHTLLNMVKTMEPHVMCGDFNIPRHENYLYTHLIQHYIDAVPLTYTSSLDRNLHRVGDNPEKEDMFTKYMVDYIFTQAPYTSSNVRLKFDVSDHAAVVGNISKEGQNTFFRSHTTETMEDVDQ